MVRTYAPPAEVTADDDVWPPVVAVTPRQTTWDRFIRKFKEEPLVPVGASSNLLLSQLWMADQVGGRAGILATCIALGGATSALQKGNRTQFNKYLRLRVAAQGATVFAALGSSPFLICSTSFPSRLTVWSVLPRRWIGVLPEREKGKAGCREGGTRSSSWRAQASVSAQSRRPSDLRRIGCVGGGLACVHTETHV